MAAVFDGELTYASFPAWDGQHGMMAGQSPMLTRLNVGACRLDLVDGQTKWFLLDGGFAQVQGSTLTILTESATPADEITAAETEQALLSVRERIGKPGETMEEVEHDQALAYARRAVAQGSGSGVGGGR
jgi:F-type H+-transporting ATPase subunit epsilon